MDKKLNTFVYSPIYRFFGWEINKIENSNQQTKKYIARFIKSPKDKPIMLKSENLRSLKQKIIGINLKKGVC